MNADREEAVVAGGESKPLVSAAKGCFCRGMMWSEGATIMFASGLRRRSEGCARDAGAVLRRCGSPGPATSALPVPAGTTCLVAVVGDDVDVLHRIQIDRKRSNVC